MSVPVLSVKGLKKSYRKGLSGQTVHALKGVSFDIHPGTVTGFLGANGAGKTTTIKCLLGLSLPDEGDVRFFGSLPLSNEAKSRVGFLPERPYFYEYLTGREFLRFYGELSRDWPSAKLKERINGLLKRVGLDHAGDRPLRSYSKGMLQRVGIAQALIHDPEFIILDEPMTGLDPDGRQEVRDIILETAKSGTAVFFSSHLLPDAEQLCERLVILKKGDLVFEGPIGDLLGRVSKGYQLVVSKGGALTTTVVASVEQLQGAIDSSRKSGDAIVDVRQMKASLEEAFMAIAMREGADT